MVLHVAHLLNSLSVSVLYCMLDVHVITIIIDLGLDQEVIGGYCLFYYYVFVLGPERI